MLKVPAPELSEKSPAMVSVLDVEVNVPELIVRLPDIVKLVEVPAVTVPVVVRLFRVSVVPEFVMVQPVQVIVPLLEVNTAEELLVKVAPTVKLVLPVTVALDSTVRLLKVRVPDTSEAPLSILTVPEAWVKVPPLVNAPPNVRLLDVDVNVAPAAIVIFPTTLIVGSLAVAVAPACEPSPTTKL